MAHDGEEPLPNSESEKPSLILLDIMMPKLDGWQVCRQIRQKERLPHHHAHRQRRNLR